MPSFKPKTNSLSLLPLAGVRFLFPSLFLFLFVLSVSSLADEGMPEQQDENGAAISTAIASDGAGNVLSVGRRWLATPTADIGNVTSPRYVGWLKLVSASTGQGVNTFNSADNNSLNLNESTPPPDAGSIYVDLSASNKESLCTSAVWDSTHSVFWVACRSVNSSSKYLVYLLKVTTAGVITSYSTTLGNGNAPSNNKHGYPGRQGSLMLDDTNTSLVLVGYKGTGITSPYNTTNDYRPFIAKFTISGADDEWAPAYQADFATTDSNSTTGAYGHRAVAVVKAGSFYYSAYTHLTTGGVRIAKFATSDLAPSSSGFFAATTFPSGSVGNTPTSYPTSMAYNSNNSTTLLVGGSVRSSAAAAYLGFVMAVNTDDGTMVTACDTDGFNLFSVDTNATDTLVNDIILGCSSDSLNLVGAAHNGINYKPFTGLISLASNACSFNSNYGSTGLFWHSEGGSDTFYTAGIIDSNTVKLIVAGRQVVVASNGVFRAANYLRSFTYCSATDLSPYVNSCSMTWGDNSYTDTEVETGITGTLTFSDATTTSVGLSQLACVFSGAIGAKSGEPTDNFIATAPTVNTGGTAECWYGSGANRISCGPAASIAVVTIPKVVNVTSTKADDAWGVDEVIDITVEFSSAVTVSGTPTLTLNTGTTDTAVNYLSGSGTTTLTFSYTVAACDSNSDLDYVNANSLSGTITSGGVAAILTLPTPGAAHSLGDNKALNVQGGNSSCYQI